MTPKCGAYLLLLKGADTCAASVKACFEANATVDGAAAALGIVTTY
jgi:hypothetical protein